MSASRVPSNRKDFTLPDAVRLFCKHPSPWMIGATLAAALAARIAVGDWQLTDALVSASMVMVFPFVEWAIHVFILHWRPRRIGKLTVDPLLACKHRQHHADPRIPALVFIPAKALPWILAGAVAIAVLAFPRIGLGLTFLTSAMALGLGYEWTHHLIHTDYKPKTSAYHAIWRNHRLHHFKTSTTGSPLPPPAPPTGYCGPTPTPRASQPHQRPKTCTPARSLAHLTTSHAKVCTLTAMVASRKPARNFLSHIGVRLSSVLQVGVGRPRS